MSETSAAGSSASPDGAPERSHRQRYRHRKRRKPQIVVPTWRWWHVLAAVGVAMIAGAITIALVRGAGAPP